MLVCTIVSEPTYAVVRPSFHFQSVGARIWKSTEIHEPGVPL
jgi:hypothetical protein